MNLNSVISNIGNSANNALSGIGQGIGNFANGIGGVVQNFAKGLSDEWQNAQQTAQRIPQDVSNAIPQQVQQPVRQGFSNLTGNIQNVTRYPQVAQTLPDDVRQSLVDMTNRLVPMMRLNPAQAAAAQFAGNTAANLTGTVAKGLAAHFTGKPMIEQAGDIAGSIGATAMPESAIGMGVFTTAFNPTVGSLLQGQMPHVPTPEETAQNYQQGMQFGAQYGPIAKVLSPLMNPVSAKLAPEGVAGLKGVVQRAIAGGITSAPAMAAVGGMQPAASQQERMQNIGNMALQGLGFGAVGGALSKPSLPSLSEQYSMGKSQTTPDQVFTSDNGIKYTGKALDAYEKLVPTIATQQQEFNVDPDGAMAKMLPQDTYDQWYQAQPMNHSEGGNTVLKDARGYFGYINPNDIPHHAQDATNVMDNGVFGQLTANSGYPQLAVVRQTYDTNGNPNPLEITDGHHTFPISKDIGRELVPAVILDDSKPLLRDQFNQMKGIRDMTIGQMQPAQRGLVSPYSGGAEANLAYLQQPGTENPQAGFLNIGANVGGISPQDVYTKALQSGKQSLTPDEVKVFKTLPIQATQDLGHKALPGFAQWVDNITGFNATQLTPEQESALQNQFVQSGAAERWNYLNPNRPAVKNLVEQERHLAGIQEPIRKAGNASVANAYTKAVTQGAESLTTQEQDALNTTYLDRIKALQQPDNLQGGFLNIGANIGGEETNVRNLKTPQAQRPSDIGDQENVFGNQPVMAEQGNVLAGMRTLNQVRPTKAVPSADDISSHLLALKQLRPTEVTPENAYKALTAIRQGLDIGNPNNTFTNQEMGMQQLNQLRLQQNPDFYGTQANAPTDGSARPPAELSQALSLKSTMQDNLTNAKLIHDNYDQYKLQAQAQGDKPATKAQINQYVKTLQKNADTLDNRIKTLQPDNPLLQNQIQASQDAPQAMQIAQDAAAQNGAQVTARIKSMESQADQMDRKGKTPATINDNLGFRVIAPTQAQADMALEQIKANPLIKVVKQENVTDPKTGYAANHLDVKIGDSPQITEYQGMTQDMAKLSQDTHDQYKVLSNPPTRVQLRQLTQLGYQPDQLAKISQQDAKGIITDKILPADHPIANEPSSATIPPASGTATLDDAVSARFSTIQNIDQRASRIVIPVITDAVRTPVETEAFRQAVEHPDQIGTLAQQAHDPNKFINAVNQFNNFNDYVFKTAEQSGLGMGYVKDYYSHILDLSDPKMQDKFNALMQQRATNYKGYFTKSRIFTNIDDLRQQGFQLKNPNVPLDLQEYSKAAQLAIGNSAFLQKLAAYKPDEVKPISKAGMPVDSNGRSFLQSKIPGLSDTAFSQDLTNELKNKIGNSLEPGSMEGVAKYYDKANAFMKQVELSGGGFHILNTAPNYVADQILSGHFPGVAKAAQVFFDPRAMNAYRQQAVTDGTLDKASAMNVTLSKAPDITTDTSGNIDTGKTANPIKLLNQGIFGRLMDYFKLETVRNANIDLSTSKGIADARNIGAQINNMFGGQNRAVGDSIFKSKGAQMLSRAVFLAPDYQEGRIGNAISALKGITPGLSDVGSRYAAKELLGRILVTAGIAETARRLISGNFDSNVKDMFQHAFLDPQTPLPFNSNPTTNAPQGNPLIGRFPSSEPADMYRMTNDPVHFLLSHLGALPSTLISAGTGKDYYGQDLVDPYAPKQGGISGALNTAKVLAQSKLPIPGVQLAKLAQGKVNVPTALTNTLGVRVAQNPNNPGVVYETNKAALVKNLTPNQQAIFNTLNPQKTDPYTGQPISNPSMQQKLLSTPEKAQILLTNPDIMKAQGDLEKQDAVKTGQQYDPIYDLSSAQQHTVNLMRTFLPGQSTAEKTALINANPWYKDFVQKESEYFGSLDLPTRVSLVPTTLASPIVQKKLDYYNTLPSGTGVRTAFINANSDVADYFKQYSLAKTQEQMDLGLIPIATSSISGGGRSSSSSYSSNYDQAYLDRALLRSMLLQRMPVAQEQKVPTLFLQPGQSATSQPIMRIQASAAAKKPLTAVRFGGNQTPTYSRTTVSYRKPNFTTRLQQMGNPNV